MTDDERGKHDDATEETAPNASPSPSPTPPPPDVSMFDEALEPLAMPDILAERERAPRAGSSPDLQDDVGPSSEEPVESFEEPDQLTTRDSASGDESPEASEPGLEPDTSEPQSTPRARITLKIPDDTVPLSSPRPPLVESTKSDQMLSPAAVVQAMRIISIGDASPRALEGGPEDGPLEKLEPEDQLRDMEPLSAHDVESTWTPPAGKAVPPRDEDDAELGSEEVEPLGSEPPPLEDEEELEPETLAEEEHAATPPPVTVAERPAHAESPSPPPTAPLSPSASAPPPPTRTAMRSTPQFASEPLPTIDESEHEASPEAPGRGADEPSTLELGDDEIAPASTESPSLEAKGESPAAPPPPPPPPAVASNEAHQLADTPPEGTPPPPRPRPKVPPPPKKRTKSDLERREPRARPGWEEVFADEFVRAYPRLTHHQIATEVAFIEKSLGVQRGGVVLDLGCGSGQHAVELASRGYNVVGYDLSLTMLAMAADEAQERAQKINFLQGDMREMAFEEMFDGIFSWGTSFGFFDEEKNISVIQRVHRALRKGGMFLLDVFNRDFICARLPALAWFEGDGCVCIDDAQFNSITSRLRVKRTIMIEDGTSREVEYSVRLYSLHEIGRILHDAGFKVVQVSGHSATEGAFFDAESPRLITLAVRR